MLNEVMAAFTGRSSQTIYDEAVLSGQNDCQSLPLRPHPRPLSSRVGALYSYAILMRNPLTLVRRLPAPSS